eukprot:TRINITY_DN62542_c0_g2_i1.p1 TRINITY_DN62542_c0_g2~~TRINITY_DN62542_c0_g2_i1.p1  ORF type:complete len:514 (-),score=73.52 TRINITY_DN62542_c0_g2_i1:385-1812(-)
MRPVAAHRRQGVLWSASSHQGRWQQTTSRSQRWQQDEGADLQRSLPSRAAIKQARKLAQMAEASADFAEKIQRAHISELLESFDKFSRRNAKAGEGCLRAWEAAAARSLELSRTGELRDAADWARILVLFKKVSHRDAALLLEAERCFTSGGVLASADTVAVVADIVSASRFLAGRCPQPILLAAASRLGELLQLDAASSAKQLGVARIAELAGACADASFHDQHIADVIKHVHTLADLSAAEESVLVDIASFLRAFGLQNNGDCGELEAHLLPGVSAAVWSCSLTSMAKLLPFLAHYPEHRSVVQSVVQRRMTSARTDWDDLDVSVMPGVFKALAVASQRDLSIIQNLCKLSIRGASRFSLSDIMTVAVSLQHLKVRHEVLMCELADNIVVQHQRSLNADIVIAVLEAWTTLRVPHPGLHEACRACMAATPADQQLPDADRLLEDFESLQPPGPPKAQATAEDGENNCQSRIVS